MSPGDPRHYRHHPRDPIGYGRRTVPGPERGAFWPTRAELRHEVVLQDLVLRWIGAGRDHLGEKGFLAVDGFPVAIDLGGLDINTTWWSGDAECRCLERDYGGLLAAISQAREERAHAVAIARERGPQAIEVALGSIPIEWAEPLRRERVGRVLRERLTWVLAAYE